MKSCILHLQENSGLTENVLDKYLGQYTMPMIKKKSFSYKKLKRDVDNKILCTAKNVGFHVITCH